MHNISKVSLKIDTEVIREAIWESRKGCSDSSKALGRDHAGGAFRRPAWLEQKERG